MKKLVALILAGIILCSGIALAAEWPEGTSPAKPRPNLPEADLSKTMGYITFYPNTKLPAQMYCDMLEIFLPREDIVLGSGTMTLHASNGDTVYTFDFSDDTRTGIRSLNELELNSFKWGGGVCVFAILPRSLTLGESYYVTMQEGCFTTADGTIPSLRVDNPEAWTPVINTEYGISELFYMAPPAEVEGETDENDDTDETEEDAEPTAEPTAAPTIAPEDIVYKIDVEAGDIIVFDLVLAGDATVAVIYSENDSVDFETVEYTESGTITGKVKDADLKWGVAFLDGSGNLLKAVQLR